LHANASKKARDNGVHIALSNVWVDAIDAFKP
jgi:hypothetical protein